MTTPVRTSGMIRRWKPSVKRYPRLWIPTSTPTVTKLTVLTVTTRNPASKTGPAEPHGKINRDEDHGHQQNGLGLADKQRHEQIHGVGILKAVAGAVAAD